MTQTKVQSLVDVLVQNNQVLEADELEVLSDEAIEREITNRERIDLEIRSDRAAAINAMFPARTEGALYEKTTIEFSSFDF